MKKIIHILLLFSFILSVSAQSLKNYLNDATENNPSLRTAYSTFEASMKQISQVNALPDPKLSLGYFISPIETRIGAQQAKLSLTQMFPWFGTLKAKENVATLQAETNYERFLDRKNELFLTIKKAYYPLFEIKQHMRLQQHNLKILKVYKQLATTAFANAKGTMTDVLRVEIMIEDVKTAIQLLKDKIQPLEISFNRLLNRLDTLEVIIADTLQIDTDLILFGKGTDASQNPKIKILEKQLTVLKAQEIVEQKNGLPQIGVGMDYAFISKITDVNISNNGKNAFMPMLSITIPIFRKKYLSAIEENRFLQKSLTYQIKNTENNLITAYKRTLYEAEKIIQLDSLYGAQERKIQRVINLLHTDYSNSGKNFEEVLRMQQQLLKYEMERATIKTDFYLALSQLEYIITVK